VVSCQEKDGNVVIGEIRVFELIDNLIGLRTGRGDAEYRFF